MYVIYIYIHPLWAGTIEDDFSCLPRWAMKKTTGCVACFGRLYYPWGLLYPIIGIPTKQPGFHGMVGCVVVPWQPMSCLPIGAWLRLLRSWWLVQWWWVELGLNSGIEKGCTVTTWIQGRGLQDDFFILFLYTVPRESKNQTLPIGSGESFFVSS